MRPDGMHSGELLLRGLDALLRHDLSSADDALARLEREGDPQDFRQLAEAFLREVAK